MTQKDKELLLKDLCARLPYMPKIKITYQQQGIKGTDEGNVSCDAIEHIVNDLRNSVITVHTCINGKEGWYLEDRNHFLYSGCCATKKIALEGLRALWHEDAQKYLKRFKDRSKTNYIW